MSSTCKRHKLTFATYVESFEKRNERKYEDIDL